MLQNGGVPADFRRHTQYAVVGNGRLRALALKQRGFVDRHSIQSLLWRREKLLKARLLCEERLTESRKARLMMVRGPRPASENTPALLFQVARHWLPALCRGGTLQDSSC